MDSEIKARIRSLNRGPWIKRGREAWSIIGAKPKGAGAIAKKQRRLKKLLRPHWRKKIRYDEGVVRDSFDEALTIFQLYELAIENGYLPLESIAKRVRRELEALLWSDGAREYLKDYSYVAVGFLAQRVGVDLGFKEVSLPRIQPGSEARFAAFLSQHTLWYGDPVLDGWIGFLDDYQEINNKKKNDKELLWHFLNTKQRAFKEDAQLWTLVAGADRFITRLAELVAILSESEKPSYGMFYAYWMAKMYGYDLHETGFVRDREQEDWAADLLRSKRIQHQRRAMKHSFLGVDLARAFAAFEQRDRLVRKFWDITRKQFESDPIQFK